MEGVMRVMINEPKIQDAARKCNTSSAGSTLLESGRSTGRFWTNQLRQNIFYCLVTVFSNRFPQRYSQVQSPHFKVGFRSTVWLQ